MVDERLIEAIECCRGKSEDLALEEMALLAERLRGDKKLAEQFQRLQQLDAKIADAFPDVPVPDGLAERLVARLREEESAREKVATDKESSQPTLRRPNLRGPHRRTAWVAALLATAAAVLLVVRQDWFTAPEQPLTVGELRMAASDWYEPIQEKDDWRALPPPEGYAISPRVNLRARRWTHFSGAGDGIAYDLSPPGSRHGTYLLVVRSVVKGLVPNPPRKPLWTQGRGIAEWQSGELAYVLVVEGPIHRYRKILDTGVGPLARVQPRSPVKLRSDSPS